jgi:hypothetical protein
MLTMLAARANVPIERTSDDSADEARMDSATGSGQ